MKRSLLLAALSLVAAALLSGCGRPRETEGRWDFGGNQAMCSGVGVSGVCEVDYEEPPPWERHASVYMKCKDEEACQAAKALLRQNWSTTPGADFYDQCDMVDWTVSCDPVANCREFGSCATTIKMYKFKGYRHWPDGGDLACPEANDNACKFIQGNAGSTKACLGLGETVTMVDV